MDGLTDGFRVSWTLVNQVVAAVEKKSSPGKCKSLAGKPAWEIEQARRRKQQALASALLSAGHAKTDFENEPRQSKPDKLEQHSKTLAALLDMDFFIMYSLS